MSPGWAQPPQPAPTTQPAAPAIPVEFPKPSQVFPDGEFPTFPAAPEGGIPATPARPGPGVVFPGFRFPPADYAPPGYEPPMEKDAPGAVLFRRLAEVLTQPGELYEAPPLPSAEYLRPAVGPHEYADYAPYGYEARDTDEGQAPGVPEFTPITAPHPTTQEQRDTFVTRGLSPGSFLIPGTNTSFRLRGFVRLTGLYDFNPIGSRDDFVTNTIPVPQQSGENHNVSARPSRFALETWTPTPVNDWNVHTFIEADFFNGAAQAVGGGGNPFRLRFAFVDFGWFRVGQQNTVFMDGNAFPTTVDFAGPRGLVNQRRPGFRATIPLADQLFLALGVEQPFSDITTNGEGTNAQDVPDFAAHLRYETDYGHVQISTLLRDIQFQPTTGSEIDKAGFGMSGSVVFHPWALLTGSSSVHKDNPTGLERCRILAQYTFGWGIGRYIQDTAGLGLDGQVDPATGSFDTLYAAGWSLSYEHWFTEKWLTNLTYTEDFVGSNGDQPGSTYRGAKALAASLWYVPFRNMSIGAEYIWGQVENLDGERAKANRFNALVQYNF
jgi:hypothetical protein